MTEAGGQAASRSGNTVRMGVSWITSPNNAPGKRASPNKSGDSGFSDSGSSALSSPCGVREPRHISRVYLQGSSRQEEHYQSPSSLPVFSTHSSTQTLGEARRRRPGGHRRPPREAGWEAGAAQASRRNRGNVNSDVVYGSLYADVDVPKVSGTCGKEIVSLDLLLQEYHSDGAPYGPTFPALPVSPSTSISRSTTSLALSSPALSQFSETSSRSGSCLSSSPSSRAQPRSPVSHWLRELPSLCEAECSVMLQSKSLAPAVRKSARAPNRPQQDVRKIQEQARTVSRAFAELCRNLGGHSSREDLCSSIRLLEVESLALIQAHLTTRRLANCRELLELPGVRRHQACEEEGQDRQDHCLVREQQKLQKLLQDLKVSATRLQTHQLAEIVEIVTKFGGCLTALVELMLSHKVEQLVGQLREPRSVGELETCLAMVTSLGLEGNHLCRLVCRHGGVRLLVSLLTCPRWLGARGATLRALGTVCCVLEAIRQLEEVQGVEVIAGILGDLGAREVERAEAAGVLAQVTSPWIEENDYILGITENAFYLVQSLTELCHATRCPETFLLSAAALANLSFLSPLVLTAMSQMETVAVLLAYLSHNVRPNIYIQDQVATVLANMAARPDTRDLLLHCELVHVLLYLLAASPDSARELAMMAATQRVQQKAAIAIARLAGEPSVVSGILSGSGLERLVELSVCKKARLESDSTLVAVITAVRRISEQQDISPLLASLGAPELLNPCLINSFQLFATKHESFV